MDCRIQPYGGPGIFEAGGGVASRPGAAAFPSPDDRIDLGTPRRREISLRDIRHFGKAAPAAPPSRALPADAPIFRHIDTMWERLERSCRDPLSLKDDKSGERPVLYVAADEKLPHIPGIDVKRLPRSGRVAKDGLLYVPNPYVVPGGRFNEMYGWDSHFITLGLLESGKVELAKQVTENLFYEIDHYGKVLNANRTYYLERGNPPFLGASIKEI